MDEHISNDDHGDAENRRNALELCGYIFDRLKRRCEFLEELYKSGHTQEAMLLCLCYIDGLAWLGWAESSGSTRRFIHVLTRYGGNADLRDIGPGHLLDAFCDASERLRALAGRIETAIGHSASLRSRDEIIELVTPSVTTDELERLKKELWRGTLAATAYRVLRCALVHESWAHDGIRFESRDLPGQVQVLDFWMLYGCLQRILPEAKQRFLYVTPHVSADE